MVLSRLLVQGQLSGPVTQRCYVVVSSTRSSSSHQVAIKEEPGSDKPGFFQRIALRAKGIPLPGEDTAPTAGWFTDIGKKFTPPEPYQSVPKDFKEFPERDLKNFPYPERHMYPPKTRMIIIPDSWLTPFHKITGTSGPYLFLGGLLAFLYNKEILSYDEDLMKLHCLLIVYYVATRTFNYRVDKHYYGKQREKINQLKSYVDDELKDAREFRQNSAAESESLKALEENFPTIMKENLALQLEATYRSNVDKVSSELKRRIDYLQEVEATKQRFERDILLKSIIEGVQNQIDKNVGNIKDAYLDNCINQLKTLPA